MYIFSFAFFIIVHCLSETNTKKCVFDYFRGVIGTSRSGTMVVSEFLFAHSNRTFWCRVRHPKKSVYTRYILDLSISLTDYRLVASTWGGFSQWIIPLYISLVIWIESCSNFFLLRSPPSHPTTHLQEQSKKQVNFIVAWLFTVFQWIRLIALLISAHLRTREYTWLILLVLQTCIT